MERLFDTVCTEQQPVAEDFRPGGDIASVSSRYFQQGGGFTAELDR